MIRARVAHMKEIVAKTIKASKDSQVSSKNFRNFLIHELESRVRRNPAYSMRSFARHLGLASSGLSRILSGQQGLSLPKAKEIAKKLDLNAAETEYFCSMVQAEYARSPLQREQAIKKLQTSEIKILELSLDVHKAVSEWYYFAILALAEVSDFQSDPAWIAERMGLEVDVVKDAIDRLLKIKLLKYSNNGTLKKTDALVATSTDIPSRSIKSYHTQILKKAETALYDQDVSEREFAAISFAMDQDDIKWAKDEMRKFRRELTERLAKRKVKSRLYNLSMQLFAIDAPKPKNERK